jgi:diacylglycerol kinase (ATP)
VPDLAASDQSHPGKPTAQTSFDRVSVIYNPASTGDAAALAEELRAELTERRPDLPVDLRPTEHAGHARTLAADAARHGRPLIVSVSGDGGYNEVVNGIMDAGNDQATAAVKAGGNANDHRRATKERSLIEAIAVPEIVRMDLLRLTIDRADDRPGEVRYAHSYIGVGLTPVVAVDLEKGNKGSLRELATVVRTFSRFRPFEIELASGERTTIDSLLFANIPEMAKVATLSENGDPDDGRFEVITLPHLAKWRVLLTAVRAATRGLGQQPTATTYRFTPLNPMPLQIDGELLELAAGERVRVDIAPGALATIR